MEVVSPTANRAVPIESPEDERLASSLATSRGLESTRGSSPHEEEPSPQGGGRRPLEVMEFYSTLAQTSLVPRSSQGVHIYRVDQKGVGGEGIRASNPSWIPQRRYYRWVRQ